MAERKTIRTTVKEIVAYWREHMRESGLSIDFTEAHERCWHGRNTTRCTDVGPGGK